MAVRKAGAVWNGSLREGAGTVRFGSGEHAYEGAYSFPSRFEEGDGTNPEELIAAAHAGCFSMALSSELGKVGFEPISIETEATLTLEPVDGAQTISRIELDCVAEIPGIAADAFLEQAEKAKENCPVSRALAGVSIQLKARLSS